MPMDLDQIKRDREAHEGGISYNWPQGDTTAYLLPPREGYRVNYLEYGMHRIGPGGNVSVICFNPRRSKVMSNERFLALVKERGIKVPRSCAVCDKVDSEDLWTTNREEALRIGVKIRALFLIIPWMTRASAKEDWRDITPRAVKVYLAAKAQWDEICEMTVDLSTEESDVTDPNRARLVKVHREGAQKSTRYSASSDVKTVQEPLVLSKEVRAIVAKALADPAMEYEKIVAGLVVSPEEIEALMQGVVTEVPEDAPGGTTTKECLGNPSLFNPNDPECRDNCKVVDECAKLCDEKEAATKARAGGKGNGQKQPEAPAQPPPLPPVEAAPEPPFESFPFTGGLCSVCMKPQRMTPSGNSCGEHGGAPPYVPPLPKAEEKATNAPVVTAAAGASKEAQASEQKTQAAAAGNVTRLEALLKARSSKKS